MELTHVAKLSLFLAFVASTAYVHLRGQVRYKFSRQLFDHSTFLAPLNAVVYLFSSLPAKPYLKRTDFPELDLLKENWQTMRAEALALEDVGQIKASDQYDDAGFNSFFKTGWKRFYLKWYGAPIDSALKTCPKTCELLAQIPNIKAAMFASLPPGARLVKHRDPYAGSVRYHLGLITPNDDDCKIFVDGKAYSWRDGEDVVFDETYIHHAENKTDKPRIILFCDIERPMRNKLATWFNHLVCSVLMSASQTKNMPGDKVGWINKVFKYAYQFRKQGKKLKRKNRKLYYLSKYIFFAALFYLIFL